MKRITQYILFLCLVNTCLQAQSVETFVQMAKENNMELKSLETTYLAALETKDQAGYFPDLQVGLAAFILPVETRVGPQRLKLGATQMIPWPGKLEAEKKLVESKAEIKSTISENHFINIAYEIRKAYYTLYLIRKKQALISENLALLDALEGISKVRMESGDGKLSDVVLVQRKREELESKIKILKTKERSPTIRINRLTHRPLDMEIDIEEDLEMILSDTAFINKQNLDNHPQLKRLNNEKAFSEQAIAFTDFQSKPKLGVGLDYVMVGQRSDVDIPNNGKDVLMPRVNLSIPISTKRFDAKRQEESLQKQAIDEYMDDLRISYQADMAMAQSVIEEAVYKIEMYEKLKQTTLTAIDLLQTEYSVSGKRFEELLRMEMELIQYDMDILEAIVDSHKANAVFRKYE